MRRCVTKFLSQEKVIPIAFVGLLLNIVGVVFYGQHIQTRSGMVDCGW